MQSKLALHSQTLSHKPTFIESDPQRGNVAYCWLASPEVAHPRKPLRLNQLKLRCFCCHPDELQFSDSCLSLPQTLKPKASLTPMTHLSKFHTCPHSGISRPPTLAVAYAELVSRALTDFPRTVEDGGSPYSTPVMPL